MLNFIDKLIEKFSLNLNFFNRSNSLTSKTKQETFIGDNVGRDKIIHASNSILSNSEKVMVKYLYEKPQKSANIVQALKDLEISGAKTLNDSEYLSIVSDVIEVNSKGIRYWDNFPQIDKNKILLPAEKRARDDIFKAQRLRMDTNKQKNKINIGL